MKITTLLCFAFVILSSVGGLGQPQEAWVARYNGGFVTKSNLPVAMKIDAQGNIIVAGSGQNASGDFDYVMLKYAPDGTQLFATRHDSPENGNDIPAALAVEGTNVFVTGTAGTLKLRSNGAIDWLTQLKGRDVVADEAGHSYVTGFSSNDFATAKLNSDGSTNWSRFYDVIGHTDTSHKICLDGQGNVFVAGWETTLVVLEYVYVSGVVIKYDAAGSGIWTKKYFENLLGIGTTSFLGVDALGDLAVIVATEHGYAVKISDSGVRLWLTYVGSPPPALVGGGFDSNNDLCVAGGAYLAAKFASDTGKPRWEAKQYLIGGNAHALGIGANGSVYVSGTFFDGNIATMQFDSNGRLRWRKDYNGPANLADRATAMAIASDNSIYVAGYSANAQGGTDMVLIKYVETKINATPKAGGDVLLQMNGVPGSSYSFQATTDLQNWLNLTTNTADATGQATFTDTNAGNLYPFRFYRTLLVP